MDIMAVTTPTGQYAVRCNCSTCLTTHNNLYLAGATWGNNPPYLHEGVRFPAARLMREDDPMEVRYSSARDDQYPFTYSPRTTVDLITPFPSSQRVGDADRDAILTKLSTAFERGYIDMNEHEARIDIAVKAKVTEDLIAPMEGLPERAWRRETRAHETNVRKVPMDAFDIIASIGHFLADFYKAAVVLGAVVWAVFIVLTLLGFIH